MTWSQTMIASLLDIFVGFISFVTLTFYRPNWDFTYRAYAVKKSILKKMGANNEK